MHCARARHVHVGIPLTSTYFEQATWEIGTPTKFHDCYSMVNDTGWWSASCTCARESKSNSELKHNYIYDFGSRQCNQAMPASSDKCADALA